MIEVLTAVANGSIVRLPDDTIAEVVWSSHAEVHVLHGYLRAADLPGAGPSIFHRYQVELATAMECRAYRTAVRTADKSQTLTWIPVVRL